MKIFPPVFLTFQISYQTSHKFPTIFQKLPCFQKFFNFCIRRPFHITHFVFLHHNNSSNVSFAIICKLVSPFITEPPVIAYNSISSKSSGTYTFPAKYSFASCVYNFFRSSMQLSFVCQRTKFFTPNVCIFSVTSFTVE